MPDLRRDQPAGGVDLVHHRLPLRQGVAVEDRNIGVVTRGRPLHHRALGDDQPHAAFRPAAIIAGDIGGRDAIGREGPRHGRHDDSVGQGQPLDGEGAKQGVDAHRISLGIGKTQGGE